MPETSSGSSSSMDISEWDRIRSFLKAPDAPLALMEVESPARVDQVIDLIRGIVGAERVHVFQPDPAQDFRWILDWLEARGDSGGVFLIAGLDHYTSTDEATQDLWSWANVQRERWQRDHGKVVFMLSPAQTDALCRYAPMLWEWISLKFNLIEGDEAERRLSIDATKAAEDDPAPDDHDVRLAVLRQQLLRARQTGLPEKLVVRYYAWPLFQQLIAAKRYEEAHQLLESDLGHGFLLSLLPGHAVEARKALDELRSHYQSNVPKHYQSISSSVDAYAFVSAFLIAAFGVLTTVETLRSLPGQLRGDWAAAERSHRELLDIATFLGWDKMIWRAQRGLGNTAYHQGDLHAAQAWYQRAMTSGRQCGDRRGVAELHRRCGVIEFLKGEFERARTAYLHSLESFKALGDRGGVFEVCRNLEELARTRGDFAEAASWHDQGRASRPPAYELRARLRSLAKGAGTALLARLARAPLS